MTDFNKPESRTFEPRFQGSIEPSSLLIYDYWMILLKHWKLVAGLTLAVILLNGIRVYQQKLVYFARAAIEVQPERLSIGDQAYKPNFSYTAESFVNTQMEVAQSKAVAETVVRRIGIDRATQLSGLPPRPNGKSWSPEWIGGALLQHIRSDLLEGTFIIYIGAESTSPQSAAELANIWAGTLIDFNQASEVLSNKAASEALTKQIDRLKISIDQKDKQLAEISGSAPITELDPQMDLTGQKLTGINYQLIQVQNEIAEKQTAVSRLESTPPQALPEVLSSPTVQPLFQACNAAEQEYADKSKIFKAGFPGLTQLESKRDEACGKFKSEMQIFYETLLQQARASLQSAHGRAASLQEALRKLKPGTSDLSPKSSEYVNLKAAVENDRKLLQELMAQRQAAQLSSGGQVNSTMRIIDSASVPKVSVRPKRVQSMILASTLGLLFASGLAFLIHFMNIRVHTHEDIERFTQFRFLTFIPELQKKDGERINRNAFQFLAKIISTREFNGREPKVIIVTSVEPGEGKSFVASNLAMAEAYRGKKVMIMDIDMQRPNVHHVFKVSRSPGLPELLKQMPDSNFDVYSKLYKYLTVVPSGQASNHHLPMLLDDGRFGEVLKRARAQFDTIILDAGPVLITPETLGASRYADGVLLVLRSSRTPIRGLKMTEHLLNDTNVPVIGVVLNRVKVSDRSSYYYYFKSYYSYRDQDSAQQSS